MSNNSNSSGGILDRIFDIGTGVFNRVADLELATRELDLAQEYRQQQAAIERANRPIVIPGGGLDIPWGTVIGLAMIATGGVMAFRLLKD